MMSTDHRTHRENMGTGSVVLPVWPVVRLEFQAFRTASKLCEVVLSSDVPVPSDCGPNLCEHCRVLSWPRPKIVQSLYDPTSLSKFGPFSVGKFRLLSMRRPRLEGDRLSWVLPVPQSARLTNALSRNELEASLTRIQDTVWLDCCHLNTLPRFLSVHHKNHWLEGGVAGPDQLFMHLCMVILFQLVSNSINQRCWWDDTQFCWSQGRDNILDQTLSPHVFEPRASCTIWPPQSRKGTRQSCWSMFVWCRADNSHMFGLPHTEAVNWPDVLLRSVLAQVFRHALRRLTTGLSLWQHTGSVRSHFWRF